MDHPSFFLSFCSTHGDGGFLPDGAPSSLSGSAGTVSALPGEPDVSLSGGTPQNNRPAFSSTADIHRNSSHTNGNKPQPKTKMASNPCKQSEAMVKIINFVELPIVCEALHPKPEVAPSGFPFLSLYKAQMIIVKGVGAKISPSLSGR
jgi:hypothetical protein